MAKIQQIIAALEGSDRKRIVNALLDLQDESVRGREQAITSLERLLLQSEDDVVKTYCLQSLGDIGCKDCVRILMLQMFVATKENLRLLIQIFSDLGYPREATLLYRYLESAYGGVSSNALKELTRVTGFKPLSKEEMAGLPKPELADDESPMPGSEFEHGGWKILIEQKALGSPEYFKVFFFHSRAKDGPDKQQIQGLERIAKIDKSFWKAINESIIRWIIEQRLDPDNPPKRRRSDWPKVTRFIVPMAKEELLGCYAIQFESDWELEHGIEVFILPGNSIKIFQNDNFSTLPAWDKIAGRSV